MNELLEAIAALVSLVSPEKIQAISARVRGTESHKAGNDLAGAVGTPVAGSLVDQIVSAWSKTTASADEVASMLLAASYVFTKTANEQTTELVWTGPTTPFVAARRTEQALLQVINSASTSFFLTSFVAYDVSSIVKALNSAIDRGVVVSMLLESSQDHGGSINMDVIGKMRGLVPLAKLYAWRDKVDEFADGRVHAKVAVADSKSCFITSANLTGYAMERNMEAGVLLSGGIIPKVLSDHLRALVDMKIVSQV